MATLQGTGIPKVKLESVPDENIKVEPSDTPSPFLGEDEDMDEDAGDLDFSQAQQQLWLSHIPRTLWQKLSQIEDDDEIEIGKIRVEGSESNPSRVSLLLYPNPVFENEPREYNLFAAPPEKQRSRRPGQAFVFSERDLAGYKPKSFTWDELDEEGNPGQGRSNLYERHRREQKKKENKGRFVPYSRRPIPKQTAITGTIAREFEAVPVKNDEYFTLESKRAAAMLKVRVQEEALFRTGDDDPEKKSRNIYKSRAEAQAAAKANQARKRAAKENRAARVDKDVLVDKLMALFRQHRIWGLRDLKAKVNQPEAYLRETLEEIAFMWKQGDFNGKWELKDEYKQGDQMLLNPTGVEIAPKAEDTDADTKSGMDLDDDDDEDEFEDVVEG
ncbi:hypothetical protein G647_06284 [Cladophialophora carrionii CBS 160.54]|uniref:Transcription initiation factor IIF subunit beta n=1 Tax=Cladophialophora carrionii CBS 160.54 TaxID=1279043 RepID=V9D6B9_9EURO|nr:uncharacterized protein G647_06284 [Cladophialophora carrionii CBS 160.54]ETI22211.1 hypothetical protein G647_06284 [Cladophialophora carrionii CBS 160.54]